MKQATTTDSSGATIVRTDAEGFLCDRSDWSERFAQYAASRDGLDLTETHLGLVRYFREYYEEHQTHPTMRTLLERLGTGVGDSETERDHYQDYLYALFPHPLNPIAELCKLAGLPKPREDVY